VRRRGAREPSRRAGESFAEAPAVFEEARVWLAEGGHVEHWGYAASRAEYAALLHRADVVVSTANHEFFGVSVVEGVRARVCVPPVACRRQPAVALACSQVLAGCVPLCLARLAYPELLEPLVDEIALVDAMLRLRCGYERARGGSGSRDELRGTSGSCGDDPMGSTEVGLAAAATSGEGAVVAAAVAAASVVPSTGDVAAAAAAVASSGASGGVGGVAADPLPLATSALCAADPRAPEPYVPRRRGCQLTAADLVSATAGAAARRERGAASPFLYEAAGELATRLADAATHVRWLRAAARGGDGDGGGGAPPVWMRRLPEQIARLRRQLAARVAPDTAVPAFAAVLGVPPAR